MGEENLPQDQSEQQGGQAAPPGARVAQDPGSHALAGALKTSFFFLKLAIFALIAGYLLTGFYSVKPSEVRVKMQFGRLVRVRDQYVLRPGTVDYRWPWQKLRPISTEQRVMDIDRDFWTEVKTDRGPVTNVPSLKERSDGYLLTGDMNIVHMKLRVRYQVQDDRDGALAYAFGFESPEDVLRRELLGATTKIVGTMEVMPVIERQQLCERIEQELKDRLDRFGQRAGLPLGILVRAVEASDTGVKNPTEPQGVREVFADAQNAAGARNQQVQGGEAEANRIVQDAEGLRAEIVAQAMGNKARLVRGARADAEALESLLPMYESSEDQRAILLDRYYKRSIVELLGEAPGGFVLHRSSGSDARELNIQLSRTPPPKRPGEAAQPGQQQQEQQ